MCRTRILALFMQLKILNYLAWELDWMKEHFSAMNLNTRTPKKQAARQEPKGNKS